ncbi:MAG: twin-arginine translocation signal domain-containing protein, partial [Thermodesulfobacteriota bacterium]
MNTKIHSSSRRGFLKGMAIGAVGYALGSLLIHPKEAIAQSIQENLGKIPMEARWNIT